MTSSSLKPKKKPAPNKTGKGGFKKGVSGNPKGRPKGSRDKVTMDVKEAFAKLLDDNLPQFQDWINTVAATQPARALDIMINLTNYVIPRMSASDITVKEEREEIDYSKLTQKELESLWKK